MQAAQCEHYSAKEATATNTVKAVKTAAGIDSVPSPKPTGLDREDAACAVGRGGGQLHVSV